MDFLRNGKVALAVTQSYQYPDKQTFFRPDSPYPEYYFGEKYLLSSKNEVYAAVRESLHLLGLDDEHYGTKEWNPLKDFIKPGDNVLIKPNLVMDNNPSGEGTDCLYTQPAVVAPMVDYVLIALRGKGRIVIGDAPMQECKFEKLIEESGYKALVEWYIERNVNIELVDFRELKSDVVHGIRVQKINDNAKGTVIDLGTDSEFASECKEELNKMRITNYDPDILKQHHAVGKNEYYISDYVLKADCVINMPKPKCHRKAGVTISLKNMVGINVRKEYLPHHTMGSVEEGGDEYARKNAIQRFGSKLWDRQNKLSAQKKYFKALVCNFIRRICFAILKMSGLKYFEGSWWGNHTISRTIADLNKILYYADKGGKMKPIPQRKVLIVADMIVSGEKEGPVMPSRKEVGVIAAGVNPVCFDEAIATLMGFDKEKISTLKSARAVRKYPFVTPTLDAKYFSNMEKYDQYTPMELTKDAKLKFIPSKGWMGHIEALERSTNNRMDDM